jgi:hypothetical protein
MNTIDKQTLTQILKDIRDFKQTLKNVKNEQYRKLFFQMNQSEKDAIWDLCNQCECLDFIKEEIEFVEQFDASILSGTEIIPNIEKA